MPSHGMLDTNQSYKEDDTMFPESQRLLLEDRLLWDRRTMVQTVDDRYLCNVCWDAIRDVSYMCNACFDKKLATLKRECSTCQSYGNPCLNCNVKTKINKMYKQKKEV